MKSLLFKIILPIFILVTAIQSVFIVTEVEQALVMQFGDPKRTISEPGLHFKTPYLQNVLFIDKRILNLEIPQQEVNASDKKRLVVDSFARFKITNPLLMYQTTRGSVTQLRMLLATSLGSNVREVLGNQTFQTLLSGERMNLMRTIRDAFSSESAALGIEVIDVRILHADLPPQNSAAVYSRMETEREREAREIRALGQEQAVQIRGRADRERTILLAEAQRQSQVLRGEGEGEAARIFADAFGQDEGFFEFYRTLEAYRNTLSSDDTTLVISPNNEFFKYMNGQDGR